MASLESFLNVMEEFLEELTETFPNISKLKTYYQKFKIMRTTNPRKILKKFMDGILPIEDVITNRDESYIEKNKNSTLDEMGITKWWTPELSSNTKDAIWKYLNTLLFIGKALMTIPEGMMNQIETIAEKCVGNMENGGVPDIGMLVKNVQNMITPELIEQLEKKN